MAPLPSALPHFEDTKPMPPPPGRASSQAPVFAVRELSVSRSQRPLLSGLAFSVQAGHALLVHGPNGSGKSTMLRALLGIVPCDSGTIEYRGHGSRPAERALGVHTLFHGHAPGLKAELSAIENLRLIAQLDGVSPHDRERLSDAALSAALERCGLHRRRHLESRRLSQGQRQRIGLARMHLQLGGPRRLWMLDEPTAALDAQGDRLFSDILAEHLALDGVALIATHLPITLPSLPMATRLQTLRIGDAPSASGPR